MIVAVLEKISVEYAWRISSLDVTQFTAKYHVGAKPPPNVSRFLGYFALFRIASKVLTLSTPNLVDK